MSENLDSAVIVPWLVLDITGQWCLFALLITFAVVHHLPQRTNLFLVNFVLASFLATIPPALLLYAGQQFGLLSQNLCFVQAALVDGVAPLFGVAQLALVFDTWCEVRSVCLRRQHISRKLIVKYLLISAPYMTMGLWTATSFIAAIQSDASTHQDPLYVYCRNHSKASDTVRVAFSFFMGFLGIMELILELWVCWLIYRYPTRVHEDPRTWRTTIQFALRVLLLNLVQFIVIIVIVADIWIQSQTLKVAYNLLTSMNSLATFLAFGTQKNVLRSWIFWRKHKTHAVPIQIDLESHSTLDWSRIPSRPPKQFNGDSFDTEQGDTGYIKGPRLEGRKDLGTLL